MSDKQPDDLVERVAKEIGRTLYEQYGFVSSQSYTALAEAALAALPIKELEAENERLRKAIIKAHAELNMDGLHYAMLTLGQTLKTKGRAG